MKEGATKRARHERGLNGAAIVQGKPAQEPKWEQIRRDGTSLYLSVCSEHCHLTTSMHNTCCLEEEPPAHMPYGQEHVVHVQVLCLVWGRGGGGEVFFEGWRLMHRCNTSLHACARCDAQAPALAAHSAPSPLSRRMQACTAPPAEKEGEASATISLQRSALTWRAASHSRRLGPWRRRRCCCGRGQGLHAACACARRVGA